MTILIAHRGNITGPEPENENTMRHITRALDAGYHAEVDVWVLDKQIFLGHNIPSQKVTLSTLLTMKDKLWVHAKNYEALQYLRYDFNTFYHNDDLYTLTSHNHVWSHKGMHNMTGIVCMPNLTIEQHLIREAYGVCHDYLDIVQNILRGRNS